MTKVQSLLILVGNNGGFGKFFREVLFPSVALLFSREKSMTINTDEIRN